MQHFLHTSNALCHVLSKFVDPEPEREPPSAFDRYVPPEILRPSAASGITVIALTINLYVESRLRNGQIQTSPSKRVLRNRMLSFGR